MIFFVLFLLAIPLSADQLKIGTDDFPGVPVGTILDPCKKGYCNETYGLEVTQQYIDENHGIFVPQNPLKTDQSYYYFDDKGEVQSAIYTASKDDEARIVFGNYYKSADDAKKAADQIAKMLKKSIKSFTAGLGL